MAIEEPLTIEYGAHNVTLYPSRIETAEAIKALDRHRIRPLFDFVMRLYGETDLDFGFIPTEDMIRVVGGEVQMDWFNEMYSHTETGAEKVMENVTANQTRRVKTVAGAARTAAKGNEQGAAGPSETKEAPAGKKPAGKTAPIRNPKPPKAGVAASKKSVTKAAPKGATAKPAKAAKSDSKSKSSKSEKTSTAKSKPSTAAAKKSSSPKSAGKSNTKNSTKATGKAPAKAAPKKAAAPVEKGKRGRKPGVTGNGASARGVGKYITDLLLLKRPPTPEQIAERVAAKFPGSTGNIMTLIYAYRSKAYRSGILAKPEGSRGRKVIEKVDPKKAKARGVTKPKAKAAPAKGKAAKAAPAKGKAAKAAPAKKSKR